MAHLAFVFCCVVWGSTFILLERVTHVFGPVEIAVLRMFSGAAAVGVFWWLANRDYRLARRDWLNMVVISLLFTAPAQVIQAYVLTQNFGHSFFGTMVAFVPLMTIAISIPMLGVAPTNREFVGVLGGLACMWILVEDGMHRGMTAGLLALTVLIPLSSTLSNIFIKWKLSHVPAAPLTASLLFLAGLSLVPLQLFPSALSAMHITSPGNGVVTPTSLLFLFLLGVVGSGCSTMVFVWMILQRGPLFAGMTTYIVPVLSLLWGLFDRESISPRQLTAIAAILAMVAVVQSGSRRGLAEDDEISADSAESGEPLSATLPLATFFAESQATAVPHLGDVPSPESLAS